MEKFLVQPLDSGAESAPPPLGWNRVKASENLGGTQMTRTKF